MRIQGAVLVLGLLGAPLATSRAQFQVVRTETRVHLRAQPSADARSIRVLASLERLTATGAREEGFGVVRGWLPVRTTRNERGWVAMRFVFEDEESPATPAVAPSASSRRRVTVFVDLDSPADEIDLSWFKSEPRHSTLRHSSDGTSCGPRGNGDSETFRRKNRNDYPDTAYAIQFAAIRGLALEDGIRANGQAVPRDRPFPGDVNRAIDGHEGIAVTITGFASFLNQRGSQEGTNCHFTGELNTDWHLTITETEDEDQSDGIIVEPTPRFIQRHPNWRRANLRNRVGDLRTSSDSVRVTGFLFFDPDHRADIGRRRFTMWELHPVTRIELFANNRWIDLDSLP